DKPVVFLYNFNNYTITAISGGFVSHFVNECFRYLTETFPLNYIPEWRQLVAVMLAEDTGDSPHRANGSIAIFRRIDPNTNTLENLHYLSEDIDGVKANYDLGNETEMISLIKYNKIYTNDTWRVWGCGEYCSLKTPLHEITIETTSTQSKIRYNKNQDMTHDLFLRCDERRAPFTPFDFCDQNYDFDNILNLGSDLYFQRNSSFWRLRDYGFTADSYPTGSPLKGQNIQNLVFDSHFGPFLETEGFDTSQRVFGFSYKAIDRFPCGHLIDKEDYYQCLDKYTKSPYFHSVCLYGTVSRVATAVPVFTIDNGYYKSYIHTPGGLERPNVTEDGRHRQFCKAVSDYV
ncbi:unnamed protein product, partial [Medioppia subpectinata]